LPEVIVEVAGVRGAAHAGQLLPEQGDLVGGDPGRGLPAGDLLEGGPHRVDLDELRGAHLAHPGAAVRLRLDEPHGLQVAQRLPDRCLADAELGRDGALHDALTRPVGPVEDALDDPLLDRLAEQDGPLRRPSHADPSPRSHPLARRGYR
jgi:hypothetical protein